MFRKVSVIAFGILVVFFVVNLFSEEKQVPLRQSTNLQTQSQTIPSTTSDAPRISVVAENLEVPWAVAFLPEGGMLVTERRGTIRRINKDGLLEQKPAAIISDVRQLSEGGLHGIALHPDFETNSLVYVYYTYGASGKNTLNKVVRYTFENNRLRNPQVIVDQIPGASNHDGGRIKFGPDKLLYITTGDAQEPSLAQGLSSLAGKILRVTEDGKPAPGNPFGTLIYSYGHRNPQGICWDESGVLWQTEHGPSGIDSGNDELNKIEPGKNYGWPAIQGNQTRSGMVTPVINSGTTDTWAPAGAACLGGSVFFGGLRGTALYEAVVQGNSASIRTHFKGELGRIREVILGPDGLLYITTSNRDGRGSPGNGDDKILRINPKLL